MWRFAFKLAPIQLYIINFILPDSQQNITPARNTGWFTLSFQWISYIYFSYIREIMPLWIVFTLLNWVLRFKISFTTNHQAIRTCSPFFWIYLLTFLIGQERIIYFKPCQRCLEFGHGFQEYFKYLKIF